MLRCGEVRCGRSMRASERVSKRAGRKVVSRSRRRRVTTPPPGQADSSVSWNAISRGQRTINWSSSCEVLSQPTAAAGLQLPLPHSCSPLPLSRSLSASRLWRFDWQRRALAERVIVDNVPVGFAVGRSRLVVGSPQYYVSVSERVSEARRAEL